MSLTYRCSGCGNNYPANIPAFEEIIKNGFCPICGAQIVAQNVEKDNKVNWYEDAFEIFPSVISYEYKRLYNLSRTNNTYGLILEIKDCIETIIKFCTLSACAWGKENQVPGAKTAYEKELTSELLLSDWYEILRLIKAFYNDDERKKAGIQLPSPLKKLVDKVLYWVKHENKDLVKWRNDTIGHGALALEDDPDLKQDIFEKLNYISEFLKTNSGTISKIEIICESEEKKGYASARDFETESGPCFLKIDDEIISLDPYIIHTQHGLFFYDSLVRQRQAKLLNYPTGQSRLQYNQYILELHDLLKNKGSLMKSTLDSGIVTLREYNYLARLSINESYVKPQSIVEWLEDSIRKHSKGIFLLEMDRGCGKTFFTEKLNRRFSSPQDIENGNVDVRTIHISKAQTSGITRFLSDLTWEWRLAFSQDEIILETRSMPLPADDPSYNAVVLSDFLNAWRIDTEKYRNKSKILLVLDGLDEISPSTELIWSYIPKEQMLDNGVYILLSSRARNQIPNECKQKLNSLEVQEQISILATSEENKKTLKAFVKSKKIKELSDDKTEDLIEKSGYRLLSLSMLCRLVSRFGADIADVQGDEDIAMCYLLSLEELYGERRTYLFKMLLTVLATLGAHDMLSLQEMADLLQMDHIQFELLDMIADLQPLLMVERGYHKDEKEEADVNRYHFANEDVAANVINYVGKDVVQTCVTELISSLRNEIIGQDATLHCADGLFCLIAHMYTIVNELGVSLQWLPDDVISCISYANDIHSSHSDSVLLSDRYYSALNECLSICKEISPEKLEPICKSINETVHVLLKHYTDEKSYERAKDILDLGLQFLESQKSKDTDELIFLLQSKCNLCIERKEYKEAESIWKRLNDTIKGKANESKINDNITANLYLLKIRILMGTPSMEQLEIPDYANKVIQIVDSMLQPTYESLLIKVEAEYDLAIFLRSTEQEQKAISAFENNIEECRMLEKKYPEHFLPWIAHNLNSFGGIYKKKGDITGNYAYWNKSEQLRIEAFNILERLYNKDKSKYEQDYALICNTLGNTYRSLGRFSESKTYHYKAMMIREDLFKRDQLAFRAELAHSYKNYGHVLGENDEYSAAIEFLNKAIKEYHALDHNNAAEKDKWLVAAYLNLFDVLIEAGDRPSALHVLKEIAKHSEEYSFITEIQSDTLPLFIKKEVRREKNTSLDALTAELESLIKKSDLIYDRNQKKQTNLRMASLSFSIYLLKPSIVNAMDCVRASRNYIESLGDSLDPRTLLGILGELIGFAICVDIKTATKNMQECLQIADMYHNIQTVLANNRLFQFAVDFSKLALSAYLDYEALCNGVIGPEFVEPICTLYHNIGIWTDTYLKKSSEAIRYYQKEAEYAYKNMKNEPSFAFYYAASNASILTSLMNPNVHDYARAEQVALSALKNLEHSLGQNEQTDDQIFGIRFSLIMIYLGNEETGKMKEQISILRSLLKNNSTLPREKTRQYIELIDEVEKGKAKKSRAASRRSAITLDEAIDITLSHMTKKEIQENILQYFDRKQYKNVSTHELFKFLIQIGSSMGAKIYIDEHGIIHMPGQQ